MPKYKNIRVKMKNGKSRTQRVQVLASGQYKFVKNKGNPSSKPKRKGSKSSSSKSPKSKKKSPSNPGRKNNNNNKKGGGMRFYLAPNLAAILPILVFLFSVASRTMTWIEALGNICALYTAYDPVAGQWKPGHALINYGGIAIGTVASKLASKTGLNKRLVKGLNI